LRNCQANTEEQIAVLDYFKHTYNMNMEEQITVLDYFKRTYNMNMEEEIVVQLPDLYRGKEGEDIEVKWTQKRTQESNGLSRGE
jgi:hypothetical protein